MKELAVRIDHRLRLPASTPVGIVKAARAATSHPNPEHAKKRAMGFWTGDVPTKLNTWREEADGTTSLPRGATGVLREVAQAFFHRVRWIDERVSVPVVWPASTLIPRPYQERGIEACLKQQQGIIRAPTGSGKTILALALLPRLGQRALVIVRDRNLLDQWLQRAVDGLGLREQDIGIVQGGKKKAVGEHLTLALQQSLYSKTFPLTDFSKQFGAVIVDEVHDAAARTVNETTDAFHARVRLGFSADHTRKDRKEFLIEDQFGKVIFQIGKDELEESRAIVPVIVRLVPTEFQADWYRDAPTEERDFTRLVTEMLEDEKRCELVRKVVIELVEAGTVPTLVFTHRREHAIRLAERELPADGVPAGLLLGSDGNQQQFDESKQLLLSGVLKVAVGTFKSVGQGIDIPNVMAGVCATPLGYNKQFFGQVRGRICRVVPGKQRGYLYYLWDRMVFPDAARNISKWNDDLVEIYDRGKKGWVSFRNA